MQSTRELRMTESDTTSTSSAQPNWPLAASDPACSERGLIAGHPRLTNLLVPGAGNLQYLASALHELGALNLFVYSHARSTTPESLGLPKERAINLWPKEYLVRGHLRVTGWRFANMLFPIYHRIWASGVLRYWRPAPVIHVLLWGASRRVLERAGTEGSATLGLVANSHPDVFRRLLAEEADRIGVKHAQSGPGLEPMILEEVARCHHLHVESEFVRRSYAAAGVPAERIHVVRPGKDLRRFYPRLPEEAAAADDQFRVLCVGAISLRKGQLHLLEAWRQLALPKAELTLIGGVVEEIEHLVRPYAGQFRHIIRAEELRPHFVRSSVMVVPSIEDGHAHVVGEALACGIPVITTVNTGAADYIHDGVNGFIVPAASPEALAEKLLALYCDRDLLGALEHGARATIRTVGSWADRARDLADLYRRIAPRGWSSGER
jgi:glycosyltransferase involved in cell wall biosynthesis